MTEWVLVLVFYSAITTVPGAFAHEEQCHITGRKWVDQNKSAVYRANYACLPANFMNVK